MISSEESLQKFREDFHNSLVVHQGTSWFGRKAQKCPNDAWMYQELIYRLKPDFIIETGTALGGSTTFLADMLSLVGKGHVITIENDRNRPTEPLIDDRITQVYGSSVDNAVVDIVKHLVENGTAIVILDSDHSYEHVSKELEIYKQFVKSGYYLIVEDTHMNATHAAVDNFLEKNKEFVVDRECEKFLFTFNPGGFLKKI